MSVEATGWAFRQKLPPKPKIVLLALADQTDERTGRVCYGRTDMKYLAEKCSIAERSLYRYLAALIRNGYAIRESGKERGHESQYWLCLDRATTKIEEWQWSGAPDDAGDDTETDDPQDVEGGSAKMADRTPVENPAGDAQIGRPPLPIGGRPRVSGRHQDISARASGEQESSFSRKTQDLERQAVAIHRKATTENAREFAIYGTRAWDAWVEYRRRTGVKPAVPPTCEGAGKFAGRRGWYFPSLFPPSEPAMSDDDSRALANL